MYSETTAEQIVSGTSLITGGPNVVGTSVSTSGVILNNGGLASTSTDNTSGVITAAAAINSVPKAPSSSLYVGDLPLDATEQIIYEKFNAIGPVTSVRICRDTITRRSLGYAYVNYVEYAHAALALEHLNFTEINGKPCRIMWSQRDPSIRRSGVGNVFIKHLDKTIDNASLVDTFSQFGNILSCKIACDAEGHSKGYGFVHFETQAEANKAIEAVNNKVLNGKMVYVGKFMTKKERMEQTGGEPHIIFNNLFVKNFPESMTDDQLHELFSTYGSIISAIIMKDSDGHSKGFGFVCYEEPESALKALEELNGHKFEEGQQQGLYVSRALKKVERQMAIQQMYYQSRGEREDKYMSVNLYVRNLDSSIDDEALQKEFSPFGTILSAKVMRDEKGNSKGFGFVSYNSPEEADNAMEEMNLRVIGVKPLYVALAQSKEERKALLTAKHVQNAMMNSGMNPQVALGPGIHMYGSPGMYYQPHNPGAAVAAAAHAHALGNGRPPRGMSASIPAGYVNMIGHPNQRWTGPVPMGQPQMVPPGFISAPIPGQQGHVTGIPIGNGPVGVPQGQPSNGRQQVPGMRHMQQQQQQQPTSVSGNNTGRAGMVAGAGVIPVGGSPGVNMRRANGTVPGGHPQQQQATAAVNKSYPPTDLGDRLFLAVYSKDQKRAEKITGIILSLGEVQVQNLLQNPVELAKKIAETQTHLNKAAGGNNVDRPVVANTAS